jgi:hypothetical protein
MTVPSRSLSRQYKLVSRFFNRVMASSTATQLSACNCSTTGCEHRDSAIEKQQLEMVQGNSSDSRLCASSPCRLPQHESNRGTYACFRRLDHKQALPGHNQESVGHSPVRGRVGVIRIWAPWMQKVTQKLPHGINTM